VLFAVSAEGAFQLNVSLRLQTRTHFRLGRIWWFSQRCEKSIAACLIQSCSQSRCGVALAFGNLAITSSGLPQAQQAEPIAIVLFIRPVVSMSLISLTGCVPMRGA
jgi:hypothetical protein